MFHIGGEQELAPLNHFQTITNSGRSSLRLIIESANLRNKHILLPDFLCQVIIDTLQEYQITFDFYSVDKKLGFELPNDIVKYDALYLIKYFGGSTRTFVEACSLFKSCLIIDDVFSPFPEVLKRNDLWFSYNSLRKVSPIADFSIVCSNEPIDSLTPTELPKFSEIKYQAKYLKYNYMNHQQGSEKEYLALFGQAEAILDSNVGIYSPSPVSVIAAIQYFQNLDQERKCRKSNYELVCHLLPDYSIPLVAEFYSFAPLLLADRDNVRIQLLKDNVFLAVHWPAVDLHDNTLSRSIISIPVDSRYSPNVITKICELIMKLEVNNESA